MTPPDRESGAIPLPKKLEYRNFEIYPDGGEIGLNLPQLDAMYREMFRRYNAFVALEARAIRAEGLLGGALDWMEEARKSGDAGNWDWTSDSVYSRGRALLGAGK